MRGEAPVGRSDHQRGAVLVVLVEGALHHLEVHLLPRLGPWERGRGSGSRSGMKETCVEMAGNTITRWMAGSK